MSGFTKIEGTGIAGIRRKSVRPSQLTLGKRRQKRAEELARRGQDPAADESSIRGPAKAPSFMKTKITTMTPSETMIETTTVTNPVGRGPGTTKKIVKTTDAAGGKRVVTTTVTTTGGRGSSSSIRSGGGYGRVGAKIDNRAFNEMIRTGGAPRKPREPLPVQGRPQPRRGAPARVPSGASLRSGPTGSSTRVKTTSVETKIVPQKPKRGGKRSDTSLRSGSASSTKITTRSVKTTETVPRAPSGGRPVRGQPVRGQPPRGQPIRGQPQRGQPQRGQPQRGQPVRGQPPRPRGAPLSAKSSGASLGSKASTGSMKVTTKTVTTRTLPRNVPLPGLAPRQKRAPARVASGASLGSAPSSTKITTRTVTTTGRGGPKRGKGGSSTSLLQKQPKMRQMQPPGQRVPVQMVQPPVRMPSPPPARMPSPQPTRMVSPRMLAPPQQTLSATSVPSSLGMSPSTGAIKKILKTKTSKGGKTKTKTVETNIIPELPRSPRRPDMRPATVPSPYMSPVAMGSPHYPSPNRSLAMGGPPMTPMGTPRGHSPQFLSPGPTIRPHRSPEQQEAMEKRQFQVLEDRVEKELIKSSKKSPSKSLKATGTRTTVSPIPIIYTDDGPMEVTEGVISSKTVVRSPGQAEIIGRHMLGIEQHSPGKALKSELNVQTTSPQTEGAVAPVSGREVVQILDSVILAGPYKQTTKTVTYETEEEVPGGPNPQEVSKMIAEENIDIANTKGLSMPELKASRPVTYSIKKNVELGQLTAESVSLLEHTILPPAPTADEVAEEPKPEIIAGILNTEERGLSMASSPDNLYNYLFAGVQTDQVVQVNSACPPPLQDIVVPISVPNQVAENAKEAEVMHASYAASQTTTEDIKENEYTDTVGKNPIKPTNTARKDVNQKKKYVLIPVLRYEDPPWGITDVDTVVDVVGAPPAGSLRATDDGEEPLTLEPTSDGIEYLLHMEGAMHTSRVQLRGSQKPPWFPGYIVALPEIPDLLKVVKSPSMVLSAAWKATQPDIFKENSLFIV